MRQNDDAVSSKAKLRVLFVDDEREKVDELLNEINTSVVDIIPFEPFYSIDETHRDILAQRPDIILMDHGLTQGVRKKADGDKVLQELVERGYRGRFITNTGGRTSENFKSVMGIRNEDGEHAIIDHACKNPELLGSILHSISSDVSLILEEEKSDIITRRSIKDKLMDSRMLLSDLNDSEIDFIIRTFGADDKNRELRLSLILKPDASNMELFEALGQAEKKLMLNEAADLLNAGMISENHALIPFFPKKEEQTAEVIRKDKSQMRSLTQIAKEDGFDALDENEKMQIIDDIRKCRFGLGLFLKIRHIDIYTEILNRFDSIDSYDKKSILEEMINEDYALYSAAVSPVFDNISISGMKDDLAMLMMLKDPKKSHPKEFKLFGEYFSIEMRLATIYLTAYFQGADLPDTLLYSLWTNRNSIFGFDPRFDAVSPKAIIALISFPLFETDYTEAQKQELVSDIISKWRNRGKLSFIKEYNDLTGENHSLGLDVDTIRQFGDYDMDEVYDGILTKKLVLDKVCMVEFIKRQLAKGAYSNVEKLFAIEPGLDIGTLNGSEVREYIKGYSPKSMVQLLLALAEKGILSLDDQAKRYIAETYPDAVVQIAIEKGSIAETARVLSIPESSLKKAAADSYIKSFNFYLLGKLKRYEGNNDEYKKLYLISEMY